MKNQYLNLNAFALIHSNNISKLMDDLNHTYTDERCEFVVYDNLQSLLAENPITTKPAYRRLFITEIDKDWMVIFNDKINSDGCSSLLYNLNRLFQYEGIKIAFNELGTMFIYYKGKAERVIQAYKENERWIFYMEGELMGFERSEYYERRIKKERFNQLILDEYLERMGLPSVKGINEIINNANCIYSGSRIFI